MIRAILLMFAFVTAGGAFASGQMTLSQGQSINMDYQMLNQFGGQVTISCGNFNPGPGPGPGPGPRPRSCDRYNWTYYINPGNTSYYTCAANGRAVGEMRDCHTENLCGNEQALRYSCFSRCQAGEFNGQL